MAAKKLSSRVQTTLRLPRNLLKEARARVARRNANLNDFMVTAISAYLEMLRRREIDASFAGMAHDLPYQRDADAISAGFRESDWEALTHFEKDDEMANASR